MSSPFPPDFNVALPAKTENAAPTRFCLRCQEVLPERPFGDPECGRCQLQFNPEDPATYSSTRGYSAMRFWFPGFLVSVLSGVVAYAIGLQVGELGLGLFFGVPVSMGALLGYGTRGSNIMLALLALGALVVVVLTLVGGGFAGFFCGITLSIMFLFPIGLGVGLGVALRVLLWYTNWDQRWYLPWFVLLLIPYLMFAIERTLPARREVATVRTKLHVKSTPREAWDAIMFYEEVSHEPSWLLQLALPRPIRSVGDKRREGEVVRCFYDRGYLSKRISRVQEERHLAFDVVEQHLHFERDVELLDGSFHLEPTPSGSEITLTTRYRRKLGPRWVWLPVETAVVRSLHQHVLEGMRRKAESVVPYKPDHWSPTLDELALRTVSE